MYTADKVGPRVLPEDANKRRPTRHPVEKLLLPEIHGTTGHPTSEISSNLKCVRLAYFAILRFRRILPRLFVLLSVDRLPECSVAKARVRSSAISAGDEARRELANVNFDLSLASEVASNNSHNCTPSLLPETEHGPGRETEIVL